MTMTNTHFPLSYGLPEPDMEKEVASSSDSDAAKPSHDDDVWRQCACGSGEPVAHCDQWRYCG